MLGLKELFNMMIFFVILVASFLAGCRASYEDYNLDYMEDDCVPDYNSRIVNLSDTDLSLFGFVRATQQSSYGSNKDCRLKVLAPPAYRIIVRIRRIDTERTDSCEEDAVHITGHNTTYKYCGYGVPSYALVSHGNSMSIRFITKNWETEHGRLGFDLYYTAFHEGECDDNKDDGTEFQCGKSRCIPRSVTCDKLDNCGDWSDEYTSVCGLSTGAIVAISLVCSLIGISCFGFIFYQIYSQKKDKDRRRQRAQRRQAENDASAAALGAQCNTTSATGAQGAAASGSTQEAGFEPPPPYTFTLPETMKLNYKFLYETEQNATDSSPGAMGDTPNYPPPAYDNVGFEATDPPASSNNGDADSGYNCGASDVGHDVTATTASSTDDASLVARCMTSLPGVVPVSEEAETENPPAPNGSTRCEQPVQSPSSDDQHVYEDVTTPPSVEGGNDATDSETPPATAL